MAYTVTRLVSCRRLEGCRCIVFIIAKPLAYLRAVSYYKIYRHRTAKTKTLLGKRIGDNVNESKDDYN